MRQPLTSSRRKRQDVAAAKSTSTGRSPTTTFWPTSSPSQPQSTTSFTQRIISSKPKAPRRANGTGNSPWRSTTSLYPNTWLLSLRSSWVSGGAASRDTLGRRWWHSTTRSGRPTVHCSQCIYSFLWRGLTPEESYSTLCLRSFCCLHQVCWWGGFSCLSTCNS